MSNWSELPYNLLVEIVGRLKRLKDFVAFGAVCKGWCKAGKKEHFKGLWLRPTTPYLMLPVRDENDDDVREFYSLVEDKIVASISIFKFKERKCYESLGWLLAVEKDGSMCLLDPFSSVEIPLPHQQTFPDYNQIRMDAYVFVRKMVLSARPNETSDFTVMIICGGRKELGFWRPGDELWSKIKLIERGLSQWDVMYYDGCFYTAGGSGCACWVFPIERDNPPKCEIVTLSVDHSSNEPIYGKFFYILKTSQSLFYISRSIRCWWPSEKDKTWGYTTSKFQVYEIDVSAGTWVEINDIGNMAIFVGHNATFAVDSSRFYGKIKGNHIYFNDDSSEYYHFLKRMGRGKDMGAYNLQTGTIESFYSGEVLLYKVCPSIWITTPTF